MRTIRKGGRRNFPFPILHPFVFIRCAERYKTLKTANEGDLALFFNLRDDKRYLVRLKSGGQLHTHRGIVPHDAIIGAAVGAHGADPDGHGLPGAGAFHV